MTDAPGSPPPEMAPRRRGLHLVVFLACAALVTGCLGSDPVALTNNNDADGGGGMGGGMPPDAMLPDDPDEGVLPDVVEDVGESCQADEECDGELCVAQLGSGIRVCTKGCSIARPDDCPENWTCRESEEHGNRLICQPPATRGLCEPCDADSQCGRGQDLCVPLEGDLDNRVCARDCFEDQQPCPRGYTCQLLEDGNRQCVSESGVCPPRFDDDEDGIFDDMDNCPEIANANQIDNDDDGVGDDCDNCPDVYNPDQANTGGGPLGDACQPMDVVPVLGPGQMVGGAVMSSSASYQLQCTLGAREPTPVSSGNYRIMPVSTGVP